MMTHWFSIAIIMAFLSLDETAVGQFMFSRPIVTGPLVGWIIGRADIGLEIGALIELIWIGELPVGAHLPLDLMMLTGTSVALACELAKGQSLEAVTTFALGIGIPLAILSTEIEVILRKFHVRWLHFAQHLASNSHLRTFEWINFFVLIEQLLKGFFVSWACLTLAHLSGGFYSLLVSLLDGKVIEGFYYAHWLLLALGCSAVIDILVEKKSVIYLLLSIISMMTLAVFTPLPGVYLVAISLFAGFIITLFYVGKGEPA